MAKSSTSKNAKQGKVKVGQLTKTATKLKTKELKKIAGGHTVQAGYDVKKNVKI